MFLILYLQRAVSVHHHTDINWPLWWSLVLSFLTRWHQISHRIKRWILDHLGDRHGKKLHLLITFSINMKWYESQFFQKKWAKWTLFNLINVDSLVKKHWNSGYSFFSNFIVKEPFKEAIRKLQKQTGQKINSKSIIFKIES